MCLKFGVPAQSGKPLVKASVKTMLTNRSYLGFVKHNSEYFPGTFEPILSPTLFEAVQKRLAERAHTRYKRNVHDFPFVGLFKCGECGSMITAQWCKGNGGLYRYYRCTKKKGKCGQKYLMENELARQVKEQLQSISLPEAWADYMLKKVEEFEHEEIHASGNRLGQLKEDLKTLEAKLSALVDLHLNGDIEREIYLTKKDTLMRQKLSLQAKSSSARAERKNWVEPLRRWILDSKHAGFLASRENLHENERFSTFLRNEPRTKQQNYFNLILPAQHFRPHPQGGFHSFARHYAGGVANFFAGCPGSSLL